MLAGHLFLFFEQRIDPTSIAFELLDNRRHFSNLGGGQLFDERGSFSFLFSFLGFFVGLSTEFCERSVIRLSFFFDTSIERESARYEGNKQRGNEAGM